MSAARLPVSGCYNSGNVSGTTGYIGGVSGQHWRAGQNSKTAITQVRYRVLASVGGVAGGHKAASPELVNCYNAGTVKTRQATKNNNRRIDRRHKRNGGELLLSLNLVFRGNRQ